MLSVHSICLEICTDRSICIIDSVQIKVLLLGTHTPVMSLGNDSDKSKICPSHWGVTRFKSNQIKSKCCYSEHAQVMFLGNGSDKSPNLSKSLGGDSVHIKPDQIKPGQIKVLFPSV
jgi:hypothetical protein